MDDHESHEGRSALDLKTEEVKELLTYALETGVEGEAIEKTLTALQNHEQRPSAATETVLAKAYGELVALTSPVTGRTLLDTQNLNWRLLPLVGFTLLLLAGAICNEVLQTWLADQPTPDEGWHLFLFNLQRHFLDQIAPLLWGGIGAGIYLTKQLYDIGVEQRFDRRRFKGWWLRIVLGAVLGLVTLRVFSPESLGPGDLPLAAAAVAFLVGLGVKVVYGAFERVVEEMAERMNLQAVRREEPAGTAAIRSFLRREIKAAEESGANMRLQVLTELQAEFVTSESSKLRK